MAGLSQHNYFPCCICRSTLWLICEWDRMCRRRVEHGRRSEDRTSNAQPRPLDRRGGRAKTAGKSPTGLPQHNLGVAQYRQWSKSRGDRLDSFANTDLTDFCVVGFLVFCEALRVEGYSPTPLLKGAVASIYSYYYTKQYLYYLHYYSMYLQLVLKLTLPAPGCTMNWLQDRVNRRNIHFPDALSITKMPSPWAIRPL